MTSTRRKRVSSVAMVLGLSLALAACGGGSSATTGSGGDSGGGKLAGASLTVGSKEFTESIVLGKITMQALEAAGAKVTDKTGISGSATVRAALVARDIDIYWDYTGTGWVNVLGHTPTNLPADLYQAVSTEDAQKNKIAWLKPAPFEDSYAIAVADDFAKKNNVNTMSDAVAYVKAHPADSTICAASEFLNRDDGLPGLQKAYGVTFAKVKELDFNLIFTQIGKSCPFGEVTTTDGRVLARKLRVLEDDKNFFLEYRGAVTLRQDTLDKNGAIADVLAPVSEKLTNQVITELNSKVDVEGKQPQDVAEEWLKKEGLAG